MGKIELYEHWLAGPVLHTYGVIWVHRGRPDRKAIRAALDGLSQGRMVAIAPEGRESVVGGLEEGTEGAAFLALKSGAPIVPIAMTGTENKNTYGHLRKWKRAHVTLAVGKPFYMKENNNRQIMSRSIVHTFSSEMADAITETLYEGKYDLIIASQLQMAAYYPYFQNVPALFEELEVGLFHDQAFSADGKIRVRHALTWFKLRMYLSCLLDTFQACTVASTQERQLLLRNFPGFKKPVEIIPNCLNMDEYKTIRVEKKKDTLIFAEAVQISRKLRCDGLVRW